MVERVNTYKLLGVIISDDLRWVYHIEYISKKASKRLYSLKILKRVGVASDSILMMYLTIIRPILEYGAQVWQDIPEFLSRKLESILKRALCDHASYIDHLVTITHLAVLVVVVK